MGVVCRRCIVAVVPEFPSVWSFAHVLTASQATPTLPPPGQGEGSETPPGARRTTRTGRVRRPNPCCAKLCNLALERYATSGLSR